MTTEIIAKFVIFDSNFFPLTNQAFGKFLEGKKFHSKPNKIFPEYSHSQTDSNKMAHFLSKNSSTNNFSQRSQNALKEEMNNFQENSM